MASHAMDQTHQDIDILVQMFHKLIRSTPTSGDAQAMHSTILSIVSSKLEKCFRNLQRRYPSRTDIEPLLKAIKSNLHYSKSLYSSSTEVEQWTSAPGNTLRGCIRNTVRELSMWCSGGSLQLTPPGYTHRQLHAGLKIMGVHKTLWAIIDEVKAQTEAGNGAVALDIATSLICAPSVEDSPISVEWVTSTVPAPIPPRSSMNLREMLKAEFDNAASLVSTDSLAAESIVRLHRRVESQIGAMAAAAGLPVPPIDLPGVGMVGVDNQHISNIDMEAVNDAATASMAAAGAEMGQQALQRELEQHLDLSASAGGLDLSGMGTGGAGNGGITDLSDLDLGGIGDMGIGLGLAETDGDDWGLDFDNM